MLTKISDAIICTVPEFLGEMGAVDPAPFLVGLAKRSTILEKTEQDEPLENRLAIAVLANAALHAEHRSDVAGARGDYARLLRLANGVSPPSGELDITGRALTEVNRRNVLRIVAQHEALLGPLKPGLGRTQMLLGRILPEVLGQRPDPLDALTRATGLPFAEVRALFFLLYAAALRADDRTLPIVPRLFADTRSAEASFRSLLPFAKSLTDLKQLAATDRAYSCREGEDFRYAYSPLRDFPLVLLGTDVAVAPVARYLALVFTDGIFDFLRVHANGAGSDGMRDFDRVFGDVAEEYVRRRVDRELGVGRYQALKPLKGRLSPDGLIGDDCVVEVKGTRLLRGILTTGDLLAGAHFLGKDRLGHRVAQLLAEIERTHAGRGRGLSSEHLEDVVPCLITPDGFPGFYLDPIRRWVTAAFADVIRRDFPALSGQVAALDRLEWLSFDDVDRVSMAARARSTSFGRVLRRYRLEAPSPFDRKRGSFAPSIRAWVLERHPELSHDVWLDDAFDEATRDCADRLFEQRPGAAEERPDADGASVEGDISPRE